MTNTHKYQFFKWWVLTSQWDRSLTEGSKMKPEEVVVFNFFFALGDWCVAYSRPLGVFRKLEAKILENEMIIVE